MSGHIVPTRTYYSVFGTLICLTALTTGAALINLGPWNTVVALAIAVCKATLVVLFFMHVKYSSHLVRLAVVAGFFWLAILIALTLGDYLSRSWIPAPTEWQSSASQSLP